jgi:luciferase family oxidoreductase group 1
MESLALRRSRKVAMEDDFPEQVTELLAFLEDDFPTAHPFANVKAMPAPVPEDRYVGPAVWMLGSSMWSSAAAVEFGLPYSFAHFFSPVRTRDAIEAYTRNFRTGIRLERPEATVAVGAICAETQEEAEFLSASVRLLQQRIRLGDRKPVAAPEEALRELQMRGEMPLEEGEWPRYFVGTPTVVRERLEQMAGELGIDEVIVNTIVWDHEKRIRSYEMLAKEFGLG